MSCEVKTIGKIPDLKQVQIHLGFSQAEDWLSAVYYSVSPTGEVIAFGHGSKLIILTCQWPTSNQISTYTISCKNELENPNEVITSILCIPLYGSNVNSGADWTCIAVGLASGLVLFYTDSGIQIFSQRWHQEPVHSIKAQSGRYVEEEIHVCYLSCICILQANQLFHVIKSLKQQSSQKFLGRYGNSGTSTNNKGSQKVYLDHVPCRKWEYRNRVGVINDTVVVGPQKSSMFDYLLEHSIEKGFYSRSRSSPPQNSLVLGVGVKPYVGFYYAKEGFVQADLSDVAKAVASKVMSSLPGWLFKSGNQTTQEETQPIPTGEAMVCRFGICDIQRQGINIWLAPGNEIAAVTDNLSRIILIDCVRGVALRIWKGYRDAQCSFIKVKEKTLKGDKSERRKSMFLVIYIPRRSCLEIWALQHGPKVAAFNVTKNGQLIYNTHGLMGINPGVKVKYSINECIFLDPTDESLKEIHVPFHCALNDDNSKTAKDIHLLRRLRTFLRSESSISEICSEIDMACSNIETDEICYQCIDLLLKNRKLKPLLFKTAISALKERTIRKSEKSSSEISDSSISVNFDIEAHKSLLPLLENYEKLVEFFIAVKEENPSRNVSESMEGDNSEDPQVNNISNLSLSANDVETIQKLIDLTNLQQNIASTGAVNKVTFKEKHQEGDFIDFLSIFIVEAKEIKLNREKREMFSFIGECIFSRFLEKGHNLQIFAKNAPKSDIPSEDFISLVLTYWLEMPFLYSKSEEVIEDMTRLATVIKIICDLADDEKIQFDYSEVCPWWQRIRELLLESPCALKGLLAAIVFRNISTSLQKANSGEENLNSTEDELWEQVSQETAQWSLLIGKLDDISVLGSILGYPVSSSCIELPQIQYTKPDCSLKNIVCGGKGIVSELVAKWIINSGIHPKKIVENKHQLKRESSQSPKKGNKQEEESMKDLGETSENETGALEDPVLQHLKHLREHFPFSLESGILLCQMTWEYMSHWSKNLPKLDYLKAGIKCLESFRREDYALKHGLCCMIWNAHLKIPLEATKNLIQKTGRLPKEKLCQQDIGISVSLVADFLEYCLEFFKHFSATLEHDKKNLKYEEILQDGPISLSYLTMQQNHAIQEILDLHIQLCKVLHLISFLSFKISKPITYLFDPMANETFFIEINRELLYKLPEADLILQKHREEFLCRAVTASMDLIREDLERVYVADHINCMDQIIELSKMWKMNESVVRRHQVVEMYAHGWDAYAEELLENIVEKEKIGSLLLEIAGRRLNLFASNSQIRFLRIATTGTLLLDYLDNIKAKKSGGIQITAYVDDDIDIESLSKLSAKAFECLSTTNSKSLHIAGQMFDACSMIKATEAK